MFSITSFENYLFTSSIINNLNIFLSSWYSLFHWFTLYLFSKTLNTFIISRLDFTLLHKIRQDISLEIE